MQEKRIHVELEDPTQSVLGKNDQKGASSVSLIRALIPVACPSLGNIKLEFETVILAPCVNYSLAHRDHFVLSKFFSRNG